MNDSDYFMSEDFKSRLAVVETTSKHTEEKVDKMERHMSSISESMEKIVLVVERQSQHDKRIESLEKKTKINDERLTMLEKYKVKILAFGSGVVACLYIFAPDISKAISSGIKQLL